MLKTIDIDLSLQPFLDQPPLAPEQLQEKAVSNDAHTIGHWRETWIGNYKKNKEHFGSFAQKSIGKLYNTNQHKPAIIIGSGPSLKDALKGLRMNQELKNPLLTISCLHNFGLFQDEGIKIDYYLSLDAGSIVMKDISEGRKESPEYYWEKSKDAKLLAYAASDPKLFKNWQGEVNIFNAVIPDMSVQKELDDIEKFSHCVSSGGNALGACLFMAKGIFGSSTIMLVGADFCFSYDNTFHSYKTSYDTLGGVVLHPDIFGIPRKTWPSYLNFKFWFDKVAMMVGGEWISCSQGILGSYMGGNLRHFKYIPLEFALEPFIMTEKVNLIGNNEKIPLDLGEFYQNPSHPYNVAYF
jgi:hypothetical protein